MGSEPSSGVNVIQRYGVPLETVILRQEEVA